MATVASVELPPKKSNKTKAHPSVIYLQEVTMRYCIVIVLTLRN